MPAWVVWAGMAGVGLAVLVALFLKWKEGLSYGQALVAVKVPLRLMSPVSVAVWLYRARLDAAALPWLQLGLPVTSALVSYVALSAGIGIGSFLALACVARRGSTNFGQWAQRNSKVCPPATAWTHSIGHAQCLELRRAWCLVFGACAAAGVGVL
jgi:hypothetical protein